MIDDLDGPRLARYLAGECSAAEAEELRRWIAADPARETQLDELTLVWETTGTRAAGRSLDDAWTELAAARTARQVRPIRPGAVEAAPVVAQPAAARWGGWRPRQLRWPMQIAAGIALAVGLGALGYALRGDRPAVVAERSAMRVYATGKGERAEFRLSDGSRVKLSVDSRLRIPADYGAGKRTVYLEGEALFEVRHDESRPFLVHTANAVTEDLGTVFILRAYPGETAARVVVTEGKVALRPASGAPGTGTALIPGDLGRLDDTGIATVQSGVPLARYLAWTRGRLEFDAQPLGDVIPELERWYDIDLQLSDSSLATVPVTIAFETETADEAMTALARVLDLRQERTGRTVRLLVRR